MEKSKAIGRIWDAKLQLTRLPIAAWRREDLQSYMFRLYLEFARVMSPDRDNGKMASLAGGVHTGINLTISCIAGLCTAIERMGSGWVFRDVASTVLILISCDLSSGAWLYSSGFGTPESVSREIAIF